MEKNCGSEGKEYVENFNECIGTVNEKIRRVRGKHDTLSIWLYNEAQAELLSS